MRGKLGGLAVQGAVDTSKGTDVSGLKLKYAKGAISGSFTVYEIDAAKQKLVKNKFTVAGVIVDGVGHGLATNKKLKPNPTRLASWRWQADRLDSAPLYRPLRGGFAGGYPRRGRLGYGI